MGMYSAWRDLANDLMIARNYMPGGSGAVYPEAEFQPIVAGMTRLHPPCDGLATASAAGNVALMQNIYEAVVHLVKNCVVKLFNTIKTRDLLPSRVSHESPLGRSWFWEYYYQQISRLNVVLPPLCRIWPQFRKVLPRATFLLLHP